MLPIKNYITTPIHPLLTASPNSIESLHYLFNFLDDKSLVTVASTSKKWKLVIETNWLNYFKAAKLVQSDPQESARLLSGLSHSQRARTLVAETILTNAYPANAPFLKTLKDSSENDDVKVLRAQILIVELHLEKKISILKDSELSRLLQNIIEHKNAGTTIRLHAGYLKGLLACQDRDPHSSYAIAFQSFQEIKKHRRFSPNIQIKSDFYSYWMQLQGLVPVSDYTTLAKSFVRIACLKHSPFDLQMQAKFYVAKLALDKLARVTSAFTVVKFLKDALASPNLPENLQKEAYRLFHQHDPMAQSDSEYSFEGTPSKDSLDFARTALMKNNLRHSPIELNGKKYPLITHKTTNFYGQRLAFYGNCEVLILDPELSTKLEKHFQLILGSLEVLSIIKCEKIISFVVQYIQKVIFWDHSVENVERFVALKNRDKMNIDEFVRKGLGVCRHQALATAYIFDGLTKNISPKTGKPYLAGKVQIMHDYIKGGAHAWVTLVNDHEKLHIDTTWGIIFDFLTKEGAKAIEQLYGFDATVNQLLKTENI